MAVPKLIDAQYDGPQRIDRYDLVAEIASGGMATVYLARLSGVGGFRRFVAIKCLHPHLASEQEFVEMFLDEARLAAGIHHPNVVPILEVGASERGYYLVMEYIEGDTLARLLARAATLGTHLPVWIGIRIIADMLAGLHAAHELRDEHGQPTELVHRDVSPQNVLVGVDGNTRITDFGVARAATRLSATRAGQLKGKIAYMAPEQATGDPGVDRRADVFSSGTVLWEVLAARRLFKAENEAATLSRVISEQIAPICEVNPEIHPEIGRVVMRALSRDRAERYATCAEFADALEKAASGVGLLAAPKDVASYVAGIIGHEIAQQREAVRAWLARSEPSQRKAEVLELPPRVSALPPALPAPQNDQSHSGFIAAPVVASEQPPPPARAGSRAPLVVVVAALVGFVGVGLLVTFFGGRETVTERSAVAPVKPATAAETGAANAETAETAAAPAADEEGAAGNDPSAGSAAPPPVRSRAGDDNRTTTARPSEQGRAAPAPKGGPAVKRAPAPREPEASRAGEPGAPPAKPEATASDPASAPSGPAPKGPAAPEDKDGVDLSSPYR